MNLFAKTTMTAVAAAVLFGSAVFTTAQASPLVRVAPVETSPITNVTYFGYYGGYNAVYPGYGYGYGNCVWKWHRIWTYYGFVRRRVQVCF
jgi:hypothetical protein